MQPDASHPLGGGGVGFASIWTEVYEGQYSNDLLTILAMLTRIWCKKIKNNNNNTSKKHNVMLLFWKSPIWNESLNFAFQWRERKCSAINDQQTLTRQKVKLWEYGFVASAVYIIIYYISPLTPLHINGYLIQRAESLASASCERHSVGKSCVQAKLNTCEWNERRPTQTSRW